MGISFSQSDRFSVQETPTARKFQNIVRKINDHISHIGDQSPEDPTPFEHDSKSIWWDDGSGGGKSVYEKLLEREKAYVKNDKAATVVISHLPDEVADRELFNQQKTFICDGTNDSTIIQDAIDAIIKRGSGRIFLKSGVYYIDKTITIVCPFATHMEEQSIIEIEGERGASIVCKTDSPFPSFFVTIVGEKNKLNRVIFKKLNFFSAKRKSGKMVHIEPVSIDYVSDVRFERCSFSTSESGAAVECSSRDGGLQIARPHITFDRCHFRKRSSNFYSYFIDIKRADALDILDCSFYDLKTCSGPDQRILELPENYREELLLADANNRFRPGYVPFESTLSTSDYVYVGTDDTTLVTAGSLDSSLVSKHMVNITNVIRSRIIRCDFKHHDMAIKTSSISSSDLVILHSNTFYQMGAYLATAGSSSSSSTTLAAGTSPESSVGRAFVKSEYTSVIAINNLFYGFMKQQSGYTPPRPIYPVLTNTSGLTTDILGSLAFVYNTVLNDAKGSGIIYPNFKLTNPNPMRVCRNWKTERDRINLAYPDIAPRQGSVAEEGADDTFDTGFEKLTPLDEFGEQLPGVPWCVPK